MSPSTGEAVGVGVAWGVGLGVGVGREVGVGVGLGRGVGGKVGVGVGLTTAAGPGGDGETDESQAATVRTTARTISHNSGAACRQRVDLRSTGRLYAGRLAVAGESQRRRRLHWIAQG